MNKIPTIFERDPKTYKVTAEIRPECLWILSEEAIATEKLDGMNVRLTTRRGEIVRVERRNNPTKQQKARGIVEPWYREAFRDADQHIIKATGFTDVSKWCDGEHCCEAIGPSLQNNPLGLKDPVCVSIDLGSDSCCLALKTQYLATDFDVFRQWILMLESSYSPGHPAEGVVFHHWDGRRAKIKRKDFAQ